MTTKNAKSETLKKFQKAFRNSGFTLAELIVVVTILAVLAAIGFIALSGYSQDAKDSAVKANIRSVYTAITAESALTGNTPRYYIVHDFSATGSALSGAIVYFDGVNPVTLSGGNWDDANTNYTAGNPDYVKLKLNKDKFKVAQLGIPFWPTALAAATGAVNTSYPVVGAADSTQFVNGKKKISSYVQVAGIQSTGITAITGNFPTPAVTATGASSGLIRDMSPTNLSLTGALKDGGTTTGITSSSSSSSSSSSGGGSTCIFDDAGSTFDNCTFGA